MAHRDKTRTRHGGVLPRLGAVAAVIAVPAGLALASESLASRTAPPSVEDRPVSIRLDTDAGAPAAQTAPAAAPSTAAPAADPARPRPVEREDTAVDRGDADEDDAAADAEDGPEAPDADEDSPTDDEDQDDD